MLKLIINALYDTASTLCRVADALSPADDEACEVAETYGQTDSTTVAFSGLDAFEAGTFCTEITCGGMCPESWGCSPLNDGSRA